MYRAPYSYTNILLRDKKKSGISIVKTSKYENTEEDNINEEEQLESIVIHYILKFN